MKVEFKKLRCIGAVVPFQPLFHVFLLYVARKYKAVYKHPEYFQPHFSDLDSSCQRNWTYISCNFPPTSLISLFFRDLPWCRRYPFVLSPHVKVALYQLLFNLRFIFRVCSKTRRNNPHLSVSTLNKALVYPSNKLLVCFTKLFVLFSLNQLSLGHTEQFVFPESKPFWLI